MKPVKYLAGTLLIFLLSGNFLLAQSPKVFIKQGKTFMKQNLHDSAVGAFTKAIAANPDFIDAILLRAEAFEKMNQLSSAAGDYRRASDLKPDKYLYSYHAGRLLKSINRDEEAIFILNRSIESNQRYLPAYRLKTDCLIKVRNLVEALAVSNQMLNVKKNEETYYVHGLVLELMGKYKDAEGDFLKSIKSNKKYKESYRGLAEVLLAQHRTDEALKHAETVLMYYPKYVEVIALKGRIYYAKSDLINAVASITKAISIADGVDSFYTFRAVCYDGLKQYFNAIQDYTKAISMGYTKYEVYYKRALLFEKLNKSIEAADDYKMALKLFPVNGSEEAKKIIKQKVYDLHAEKDNPEISLVTPALNIYGTVDVPIGVKKLLVTFRVKDRSALEGVKLNNKEVEFSDTATDQNITAEVDLDGTDKIVVYAADIYHNKEWKQFVLKRTEINAPFIEVLAPYTSIYKEIFLESDTSSLFIEGRVKDESLIRGIWIDGEEAKFVKDELNPGFSLVIDISGKEKIDILATDIYGNKTENTYTLNRESAKILASNPMGKTWVVFINNSDYESFASLEGPAKDVSTMKSAFSKYDIHNVIEKRNMTKYQMERFFQIELRDHVKNQKVNSLLVWYAGHGKFINETGYWIPVDAKRDEEFTYFNINSLKAFMQSYSSMVTHVLVVTDACESGPSFYAAMRGAKERICSDPSSTKFKSSQVFSSAGYELAADNSPFTKTFAKSLQYNTESCIPIDNIVIKVSESVGQTKKQLPKFGKIQGLEDEDGTFFFIKK